MKTNKKKIVFCLVLILKVTFVSSYLHTQSNDSLVLNSSGEVNKSSSGLNGQQSVPSIASNILVGNKSLKNETNSDDKLSNKINESTGSDLDTIVNIPSDSNKSINSNISSSKLDKKKISDDLGLDSMSLPEEKIGIQGNWVKKREWLKESYKINEQIQNIVKEIDSMPLLYKEKFDAINSKLYTFYKKEGFKQADISSLFNSLSNYLLNQKKIFSNSLDSAISSSEEIRFNTLLKENKRLRKYIIQLKLDIKAIYDLDRSIRDRFKKLDDLIKIAMQESSKAIGLVDDIWNIIDDKKARAIFYELKGDSLEKVKAIKKYVTETLKQDFDSLLDLIQTQMKTVSVSIETLENREIIFRNRVERLKQIRLKELKTDKPKVKVLLPKVKVNYSKKIYNYMVTFFAIIYNFLSDL